MNRKQLLAFLAYIAIVIVAFWFHGFVAYSDAASTWFNPSFRFWDILFSWNTTRSTGFYTSNNSANIILTGYYSFISLFTHKPLYLQKFAWIIFSIIGGIFMIKSIFRLIGSYFLS